MSKNKKDTIPHYELLYIISNKYTEDEVEGLSKKVEEDILAKNNAKITFKEFWGKKKMAYPINHFNHGYYSLVEFDSTQNEVNQINHELKISNEVLRHMIVKRAPRTIEEIQAEKKKQVEKKIEKNKEEAKKEEVKAKEEKAKTKQVNLKDLDEKLDKILDTDDLL